MKNEQKLTYETPDVTEIGSFEVFTQGIQGTASALKTVILGEQPSAKMNWDDCDPFS